MASRVNTKFVVLLVTGLLIVGGSVAATAFFILFKSASQLHTLATEKVKAGDFVNADKFMSKAVAKERTNSGYMREWIDIMRNLELKTQTEFENKYRTNYIPAKRQLAVLLRTDVAAHKEYLDDVWDQMATSGQFNRRAADEIIKQTNDALRFFDKQPAGAWETLKRFRGMATTRMMLDSVEVKDEERDAALADLTAALAADPKDSEVASAIENWYFAQALSLRSKGQEDEATAATVKGREVVENFLAANPDEPRMMLIKTRWVLNEAQKAIGDALTGEAKKAAFKRANDAAKPVLDEVAAIVKKAPIEKAGLDIVSILKTYEAMLDPGANSARALDILATQSAANPQDADLLYALGRTHQDRNEFEQAIDMYEKMMAIPQKPLGMAGLRQFVLRAEGAFRQTMCAVALYDRTDAADKDKRTAWMNKAKEYRANLVKWEPEDSARGRLATAQVKFRDNDIASAQSLIAAYEAANKDPDPDALWLSAQIALSLNQPGVARTKLQQLLQVNGNDAKAVFLLASVEARLQNFGDAEKYAVALLEADPKNELTKQLLTEIRMQRGDAGAGDEITQLLNQAQKLSDAGKIDEMYKLLDDAFAKNPKDVRLAFALTLQRYRSKNYEAAMKTAQAALAADPNNEQFKQLVIIAAEKDPVVGAIKAIDASPSSPFDKAMAKIDVYRNNPGNFEDKIREQIEEAHKLNPTEPRVIEFRFIAAITSQNFEEGRKIADEAAKLNLDTIGGASFRSRLIDAESEALRKAGKGPEADAKLADAVTTLQQASSQAGFGVEAWRMLGNMQFRSGRFTDAINSYKRGLSIRPNDTALIEEYVAALVNVPGETRMDEALQFARENEKFARGSARFQNMLLNLEARSGDPSKAIADRTKMLRATPDNRDNKLALAALYVDQKDFEKARPLIDQLRAEKDDLDAVQLDARFHASGGDAAKAEQVLREYADKIDPSKSETDRSTKTQAMLSLVRSALSNGQLPRSEALIDEIRKFQDAKTLPADRTLGDMYMSLNMFDKAIDPFKRVLAGKADDAENTYAKRLIESSSRAGKFEEARSLIRSLGAAGETDPILQLLLADSFEGEADAVRAKGDEAKAKSLDAQAASTLDKAVTTFPAAAEVYTKRAQYTIKRNGPVNDAMGDINKALQLRPGYAQGLRIRAQLYAKQGNEEEALKDLRESLRNDLYADELRANLMAKLIGENRNAEAAEIANETIARRPSDTQLMMSFATLFANRGDTQRATPFVDMAIKRSDQTLIQLQSLDYYLSVLPANSPEGLAKAEAILDRVKDKITGDPALLLARSQVLSRRNQNLEARRDAASAFKLIADNDTAKIINWFGQLRRVMKPTEFTLLIDGLEREKVKPDYLRFFRSQQLMMTKEGEARGIEILLELMKSGIADLRQRAFRTLGPFFYTKGEYQKAVDVWVEGITQFPDDWEMRNNVAFTYAKFLNNPAAGLEQSKEALKTIEAQNLTNGDVYDTYGYCLSLTGKYTEAKVAFEKALNQATSLSQAVTIMTHKTEMHLKAGELDAAKKAYQDGIEFLTKMKEGEVPPDQRKQMSDDLNAFRAQVGL